MCLIFSILIATPGIFTHALNFPKCITNDYLYFPLKQYRALEHFNSEHPLQTFMLFYKSSFFFFFNQENCCYCFLQPMCVWVHTSFTLCSFSHLRPSILISLLLPNVPLLEFPVLRGLQIAKSLSFLERYFIGYITLG